MTSVKGDGSGGDTFNTTDSSLAEPSPLLFADFSKTSERPIIREEMKNPAFMTEFCTEEVWTNGNAIKMIL